MYKESAHNRGPFCILYFLLLEGRINVAVCIIALRALPCPDVISIAGWQVVCLAGVPLPELAQQTVLWFCF
jgi:hypothetical protein